MDGPGIGRMAQLKPCSLDPVIKWLLCFCGAKKVRSPRPLHKHLLAHTTNQSHPALYYADNLVSTDLQDYELKTTTKEFGRHFLNLQAPLAETTLGCAPDV